MNPVLRRSAFAVLLTASLALTGCGSDTKTVKLDDGSTVKVSGDGGSATIKTKDGTITAGKGLPDGYPSSEVPVIDGKVIGGSTNTGEYAYSVLVQTTGTATEVMAKVAAKLTGAGMTKGESTDVGSASLAQFTNAKYEVAVTAAAASDKTVVTYTLKNKG